jgi:hypothetical protein
MNSSVKIVPNFYCNQSCVLVSLILFFSVFMNSESKESILFIKQTSAMLSAQGFQLSKIPPPHSPPLPFSTML